MSEASDIRALMKAARKLESTGLLADTGEENFFLLELPGQERPFLVHLLGAAGHHTAVNLYRGPGMLPLLLAMLDREPVTTRLDVVSWSTSRGPELTPLGEAFLRKAKITPNDTTMYADPMVIPPGRRPRLPDAAETGTLLWATLGLVAAADRSDFEPCGFDNDGEVLVLRVTGTRSRPEAEVRWEVPPAWMSEPAPEADRAPAAVPFDLGSLGHSGDRWQVAIGESPPEMLDSDEVMTVAVLASHARNGAVVPGSLPEATAGAVMAWLGSYMRGEGGLVEDAESQNLAPLDAAMRRFHPPAGRPASIDFAEASWAEALRPGLEALGVRVGKHAPLAKEVLAGMWEHMMGDDDFEENGDDPELPEDADPGGMAAALQAHLDGHDDRWPDMPLPALDGLTPRAAVAAGGDDLARVEALLEEMGPPPSSGLPPGFAFTDPAARVRAALGL